MARSPARHPIEFRQLSSTKLLSPDDLLGVQAGDYGGADVGMEHIPNYDQWDDDQDDDHSLQMHSLPNKTTAKSDSLDLSSPRPSSRQSQQQHHHRKPSTIVTSSSPLRSSSSNSDSNGQGTTITTTTSATMAPAAEPRSSSIYPPTNGPVAYKQLSFESEEDVIVTHESDIDIHSPGGADGDDGHAGHGGWTGRGGGGGGTGNWLTRKWHVVLETICAAAPYSE
ncbi:hypothetical protein HKX48_001353 [Thoreauomyces humboldtii]|nr:hypothetical protein HKX48_001353 [Thoreauomyces humboldtii]